MSGFVFNDFGSDFVVHDTDGENPVSGIVVALSQVWEGADGG